jgi:phosphoadenosine phosphosulfate reductase
MPDWVDLGERFENSSAYEIIKYSVVELLEHGDVVFLTAFGPEGCVIFDILSKLRDEGSFENTTKGKFIIANLDTGYQFKETLELKTALETKYKLPVLMIEPKLSVKEQDLQYGKDLFKVDPDQCCYMRKLVPLADLLAGKLAWITSIRRDQTEVRAKAKAFEFDKKFKLGKINPLIRWTKSDVWKYIHENKVPYNVLMDQGYDSIGCEPCTSKGDERQGRWAGKDKIECGLHLQDSDMEQGGEFVI